MSLSAPPTFTPAQFVAKWSRAELSERAASQEHFLDLCRLLGQPTPAEHDATGAEYTFEKGVAVTDAPPGRGRESFRRPAASPARETHAAKRLPTPFLSTASGAPTSGGRGFADVWWRGKFGWEYKRKGRHRTLDDAYRQLLQYREALENPPLLIVCDIARIEVHTNFTGTAKQVHALALEDLPDPATGALDKLRRVFTDPDSFRPQTTPAKITEDVAGRIAELARSLHSRGHDPHAAAHFLMRCMFCLFAEDVGLFGGEPDTGRPVELFRRLLTRWHARPEQLTDRLSELFDRMRTGGAFGTDLIPWFNGGLFDETEALPLTGPEIGVLLIAAGLDWSAVEPAIFGTLFERSLDPAKRAQIGAHYTGRDDIMLVVEPVVMAPLRREWDAVRAEVDKLLERRREGKTKATKARADAAIAGALQGFLHRLASLRILDPACGSGNFLYVAIQQLLNLEKEVITYAARPDLAVPLLPGVRPTQLHGIEINPYAAELAQVVIWIGYLQWMRDNGFNAPRDPILENLSTIENRDAILDLADPKHPAPAEWPAADFIIGNPPFLGTKMLRGGLGDNYVQTLFNVYEGRIPGFSDLCCYWFELARERIARHRDVRAGLLATQGIRGGENRTVLERIKQTGRIVFAWSDREWILEGANVHVSIVGFAGDGEETPILDGRPVAQINANLTAGTDLTLAAQLAENADIGFVADVKAGAFDVPWEQARAWMGQPNPQPANNAAALFPWFNGRDVAARARGMWIIDFGPDADEASASRYELPFEYVRRHVKPERDKVKRKRYRDLWWLHAEPCTAMRKAIAPLASFVVTPTLTKHRLFAWAAGRVIPDHQLIVFARSDDYFFGVLHSAVHELWARRMGTQLREVESGFRYTPTTCFETFPLPWPPGKEPGEGEPGRALWRRIGDAARELNEQRERWLNPPEWIEPLAARVDAMDKFADVPAAPAPAPGNARALIRQSAIMALAAKDARLKKRTLTNLYNERPTWLRLAHEKLDRAVLAAYAATHPAGGWSEDWAEVWRDTGPGQPLSHDHPLWARRAEADQRVLANLLRMNQKRASAI